MNEVEKMYENAGINVISQKTKDCNYCYYYEETYDAPCHVCTADKCPFEKNIIPPFTAEKQLELIKWLANKNYGEYKQSLLINIREGRTYFSSGVIESDDGNGMYEDYCFGSKTFEEALAGLINNLWQDLTEEEQEQIREILK